MKPSAKEGNQRDGEMAERGKYGGLNELSGVF